MSLSALIMLAFRFLGGGMRRAGRGRSRFVTAIIAIALSVVPLVLVQHVADGMIAGIVGRFMETGSYHIQAIARQAPEETPLSAISSIPGVVSAGRERQGFGLLYSDSGRSGVTIRAVSNAYWARDTRVQDYLEVAAGSFDLTDENSIVVGTHIADRLDIAPGDEIRLLTVRPLGEGRMLPRVSRFTVSGVVTSGYRDLDRLWVFIPLERGLRVIPDEGARDIIGIKVENPRSLPNPLFGRGVAGVFDRSEREGGARMLRQIAGAAGEGWFVLDWYTLEEGRYISFLTSRNLLSLVMAMIVVVAAVNVSSALVLLVIEKEQEIAILRATGVPAQGVRNAFVLAGLIVGIVGAAAGTAVGLLMARYINEILRFLEIVVSVLAGRTVDLFNGDFYLEQIPVTISYLPVLGAVLFTLIVSLIAGLLPARKASDVRPDQILRHQ